MKNSPLTKRPRSSAAWFFVLALSSGLAILPGQPVIATVEDHPNSETPGSKRAVIFNPFGPLSANDITMDRSRCSRSADLSVHDGPMRAILRSCAPKLIAG
jgi:hypothetical protein